ncbi:putative hexose carrier protein [Cryomyces antarcticus]
MTTTNDAQGVPHFMGTTGRTLSMAVSIVATTGFLLFGYDQGVMSGIISAKPFNDAFPQTRGNTTWQGFVTAIYEVGCLFGAIFILTFGDKLGRRRGMDHPRLRYHDNCRDHSNSLVVGHGATAQLIIGRTITGTGNGINTSTIPTYQAECSNTNNRGLLICIEGGIIAFGTLIAYWIDFGRSYEEAKTVIAALRGIHRGDEETKLQVSIVDSIRASGHKGGNTPFSALFTGGKTQHFRRMMLGISAQFFQQLGGCNAVIYYFPILFETSILPGNHQMSLLLGGVNMIVYAISATVSWFIIEKAGRRKLFLIGTVGQCLSMVLVFACLIPRTSSAAKGAAVGLFTYIAFFGATWLPSSFFVVTITPVMLSGIGWATYLVFAIINACFFPIIYIFYPETKQRSLEEIDLIFAKGYCENMSYVRASKELPYLNDDEIDLKAREYGFTDEDEEAGQMKEARHGETEGEPAINAGGQMV